MQPLERATSTLESFLASRLALREQPKETWAKMLHVPVERITDELIEQVIQDQNRRDKEEELWKNNIYTVHVERQPDGAAHLSMKRNDRKPITDWRDKQEIKNQLCGAECEGIELYPAESRVVDTANQFHIWVMPPGVKIPIGFEHGAKLDAGEKMGYAKQRPFEQGKET